MAMENPISRTAHYTLGVRAWDAAQDTPLCGDDFAERLVTDETRRLWKDFQDFTRPNAGNAARHGIIDEYLEEELATAPDARVVLLGAGFDTRPFRLDGGRWIEIDEAAVIEHKEAALPTDSAPNPLTRIEIDFEEESLEEKLAPVRTEEEAHVVIEGVLMYLTREEREETLRTLQALFPRHTVYCDLMTASFFEKHSRDLHEEIVGVGATFKDMTESPEKLFTDAGYETLASTSIPLRAARCPEIGIPPFVIRWFLRNLRRGYQIWKFRYREG